MRKLLVAAMTAGLLTVGGSAMADVAGTGEGTSTNPNNNQVNCDKSNNSSITRANVPGSGIWVSGQGSQTAPQNGGALVICNESNTNNGAPAPIQGRIILSGGTGGGYAAADGDQDNAEQARGWARLNVGSSPDVRCGGPADAGTSNNAETNNGTQAACG